MNELEERVKRLEERVGKLNEEVAEHAHWFEEDYKAKAEATSCWFCGGEGTKTL